MTSLQVLLNAPAGDWGSGERGLGGLASRADDWEASLASGFEFASLLQCWASLKIELFRGARSARGAMRARLKLLGYCDQHCFGLWWCRAVGGVDGLGFE